ncbi:hypothetical protein PCYB_113840 [Plasmodium cynomolgi strain B]|uniref:Uncharacterized protein n=1 Tax=Plasmodium cynomolgi (strain B) TaxID=1120755 RepID=K6UV34_PLACD|nr:hypothetical protein PCYB_113840 [Plasmodium cynomolgi strain B]GAB67364.1 hypothetical protein PCYB_113840 [Plasmodium cynomolgi strain B]
MKGMVFYITAMCILLCKCAVGGDGRVVNRSPRATVMYVKVVSTCRLRKSAHKSAQNNTQSNTQNNTQKSTQKNELKNEDYRSALCYNVHLPSSLNISSVNLDDGVLEIGNLPLSSYNIVSVDYGYSFMGLCVRCKNKYIYEKITARHKHLIYNKEFDVPLKENVILFYAQYFNGYIYNFFSFFHYLFECIYNSNVIVLIGCNGPHMNMLASDMGRHLCYFMNEVNGERKPPLGNSTRRIPFEVKNELITFKNSNIYKKQQNHFVEKHCIMSNKENPNMENKTDTYLNFSLKNMVTKVKDQNNTLFSKFYNKNCAGRKDALSACYLLDYFCNYYESSGSFFLLPSRNVNYVYHVKK